MTTTSEDQPDQDPDQNPKWTVTNVAQTNISTLDEVTDQVPEVPDGRYTDMSTLPKSLTILVSEGNLPFTR